MNPSRPPRDAGREREILRLRLYSPKRAPAVQHDASELALFRAANEPRLV